MYERRIEMDKALAVEHSRVVRGPYQMTLDITNRCNLRCLHCYNSSGENLYTDDELTDEEVLDLLEDVVRVKPLNLCFCGGETLLRKELVLKGIKLLSQNGVKASMVTNGLLMDEQTARQMKEAGIYQAQVSIDGARPESHDRLRGLKGSFEKAVQAVKYLVAEGIHTGIAFTPTRWNVDDCEELFWTLKDIGVNDFRCQALMVMGRGEKFRTDIVPTERQYRKLVSTIRKLKCSVSTDDNIVVSWGDPVDHLIRFSNYFDLCCPFISIKANGNIIPSIYLPVSVGNVKRHRFIEYWEAGLARVWKLDKVKELSARIRSIPEMNLGGNDGIPKPYMEKDIEIDLIDDAYYKEVAI